MAGFFDDFVDGFVPTYQNAYKASSAQYQQDIQDAADAEVQREEDRLREPLSVFNSRRTQWFEDEAQDREYKRIAMSTVQSYGGRVPEDSWVTIYQELHNGRTIENIREDIDARGFVEITPDPATTTPTEPASAEVAQTEGMLAEGQPVPTTPDDGLEIPADAMAVGTSGADDLWGRVKQQESGNRQTDDEGSIIESEAGALGIAQVMPATAMDPGFGMKSIFDVAEEQGISVPVRDENAARALLANGDVNEAFGRQYFDTMLDRYEGDQEKALIAYNAGPDVADNFTGDRSTLPQETQGYLANILGNSATTERSVRSWGFSPEERAGVIRELGIDNNMFDMVMNGFEPEFPELRYAWGVSPDEEEAAPEWADIANVREGNYIAFAEAARLDGDETQAALIEAVGTRIANPEQDPIYIDPTKFTSINTVEGFLLAAERDLERFEEGTTEHQQALEGRRLTQEYLERTSDPEVPWYMQSDLTQNNVSSRIARATANNDFEALAYINDWITLEDARIPNTISAGYVAQRYASISLSAVADGATQADRDRLDVFRTVELPILINSLRLADRQSQGATTLISAYDNLATLQADPNADPNAIAQAEQRIRTLLNVEASEAIARDSGSPIQLIEKNDDFTFSQVTGYAHPDPQNPGQVIYREGPSADSPIIEGSYTELPDAVDRQARQVVSTLTTDFRSYTETRQQAVGAVRLLGDLGRIVDEDELVLTGTASIVRGLNNAFTEVSAGLAIMDNLFEGQGEDATITLSQVEREMRSRGVLAEGQSLQELADTPANQIVGLSQDARGLAQRKAIFEAKIVLMTFRAGGLEGQSGQAMSNRDFDRLRQMLTGGRTRETFLGTLSSYVNDRVQAVRDQHITITEDPDLRSFIQRHGYDPLNGEPRAYSIDRVFEQNAPNDRRLARGIDYLNYEPELAPARNEVTPGVTELTTMYQSGEPIVITQEFYEANREGLDAQGFAVGDTIQMQGGN